MIPLNAFLDDHYHAQGLATAQAKRDGDVLAWLNQAAPPEVRLLKFDAWIRHELSKRLDWAWAGAQKEQRIEQCRVYLERIVHGLWRRGWLLDGKRLAKHLEKALDAIGTYQRAGKVKDFWPYFTACIDRYVGANAEEIHQEAMHVGSHVNQLLGAMGVKRQPVVSMPELIAQRAVEIEQAKAATLREKQARARRREASCKAAASQPQLF